MDSAFDLGTGKWKINWPGRVAKHDLVYLTPPEDPMHGIPLGNGDVGALAWCEGSKLIFVVNKCDLWDDAEFERFNNWRSEEEGYNTTLRHAGRIILDFKMPVFDIFYLSDFKARLNLADATMTISASGAFGSVSVKAFVSDEEGVLVCDVKTRLKESLGVTIDVERFGSRNFSHWYALINRDPKLGLKGTKASCDTKGVYISHKLTTGTFALGCKIVGQQSRKVSYTREHSHSSRISFPADKDQKFEFISAVTSPVSSNPVGKVKSILASIEKKEPASILKSHKKQWKNFWMRSLMEFGDDYLDNLWHLTMYYANSSQRGKYPGRFIGGLWGWNRDVQLWNFYFHWNQQQIYWPLNAAGHHDLVESYLEYRYKGLPYSKQTAKEIFGVDGAFVGDVCDRRGRNSESELENHTPVAQIAMEFWRQYCYTCDTDFLKNRVLPYMLEAAYFFESLFEKENDGKYHAKNGTGYEGWIHLKDSITELACAKILFKTTIDALEKAGIEDLRKNTWVKILNDLALLPVIKASREMIKNNRGNLVLNRGSFKGEKALSQNILAAGYGIKEKRILTSAIPAKNKKTSPQSPYEILQDIEAGKLMNPPIGGDLVTYDGIFGWTEYAAIYPSGLIGLANKGTEIYKAAVNTAKLYTSRYGAMGFDPTPIVLARLGLGKELSSVLKEFPDRWQFFPNGWGHYGPQITRKIESNVPSGRNMVIDASLPAKEQQKAANKFPFPSWPFRHMGMESMSVMACAINESLLQSHDGVINIAPAIKKNQNARFSLHATNGFLVSTEIKNGKISWTFIRSLHGKTLRIRNPWRQAIVYKKGMKSFVTKAKIITLATKKNEAITFVASREIIKKWKTTAVNYNQNETPKTNPGGKMILGSPRMY